ncbi:hypothetical protein DFR75_11728 [Nocardia ignorata]|uniref:Uncharacterized protein n=1 Tax=Nocardia ignorata TaxID=145285 RepID=A0A4R6NX36_NOCIG|nr:hypothetical protein DFR75_11728 [Nocardia ignorata]
MQCLSSNSLGVHVAPIDQSRMCRAWVGEGRASSRRNGGVVLQAVESRHQRGTAMRASHVGSSREAAGPGFWHLKRVDGIVVEKLEGSHPQLKNLLVDLDRRHRLRDSVFAAPHRLAEVGDRYSVRLLAVRAGRLEGLVRQSHTRAFGPGRCAGTGPGRRCGVGRGIRRACLHGGCGRGDGRRGFGPGEPVGPESFLRKARVRLGRGQCVALRLPL